jgi:hypothetical protein
LVGIDFRDVLAGEHGEHPGGFRRGRGVDGNDLGVRAVRAQERRVGLIRKIPIGDESPLPGEQAPVFQSSFHIGVENTRTAAGFTVGKTRASVLKKRS